MSSPHRAYSEIRNQIISGDLPPGTRLRERDLAEELGVSRIPIREALSHLEADGFVTSQSHRGAIVTELTLRDVQELFDVRLGVEVHASKLAAQRVADGANPAAVREAMARAERALAGADAGLIAESNAELHETIVALAGNSLLTAMMRSVFGRDRWIFRMTSDRDPMVACAEHRELCDAICAGDAEFTAATAYAHIERGRKPTLETLRAVLPAGAARGAASERDEAASGLSPPALGVVVVERSRAHRQHAERQAGRVLHHPPGLHLLHALRPQPFEPGYLGVHIVGVNVQMDARRARFKALHEQHQVATAKPPRRGGHETVRTGYGDRRSSRAETEPIAVRTARRDRPVTMTGVLAGRAAPVTPAAIRSASAADSLRRSNVCGTPAAAAICAAASATRAARSSRSWSIAARANPARSLPISARSA